MTRTRCHAGPPCRFETAVREALGGLPRRLARRLIDEGAATLNGRRARKGTLVRAGDAVGVPDLPALAGDPALPVRVLHVDPCLVVLEKPAPMPTLPLDPRERGTLAAFVLGRWPECRDVGGPLTAGVAHRLDTGSSGIVLAARSAPTWSALRAAFAARQVRKEYVAVVTAPPRLGPITTALGHDPRDPRRMVVAPHRGRTWPAETTVERVDRHGDFWLARVAIRSGVTHQVRAHLAGVGAPIVGDVLYGGPSHPGLTGRHALHATTITVPALGPCAGGQWRSPLPSEIEALA